MFSRHLSLAESVNMSLLPVVWLSFLLSVAKSTLCPNDQFFFAASYRREFELPKSNTKYWIAFGTDGAWTINLVDSSLGTSKQKFKCKAKYFGAVKSEDTKNEEKRKSKIDYDNAPICCAAPFSIDELKQAPWPANPQQDYVPPPPATQPFSILPQEIGYDVLKTYISKDTKLEQEWPGHADKYYWVQHKRKGKMTVTIFDIYKISNKQRLNKATFKSKLVSIYLEDLKDIIYTGHEFVTIPED